MKKISALLFLLAFATAFAQNMVNNPGFENYSVCPWSQGVFTVNDWQVTANSGVSSPDYFNVCGDSDSTVGIPGNISGSQFPFDGDAYVGIFCYGGNSAQREYIQTQLTEPMNAGQSYHVSFRVVLGDNHGTAIGSIGAFFSDYAPTGNGTIGPINVSPQIISNAIITSQTAWTEISGDYLAQGGERYLTIGNFFTDAATPNQVLFPNPVFWFWGYYLIDSVSVTANPLGENQFAESTAAVYPNPFSEMLYLDLTENFENMAIYTISGQLVLRSSTVAQSVNLAHLPRGLYYLVLRSDGNKTITRKIAKL